MTRPFLDTNILIYALGTDGKALLAREIYQAGGAISVQCLNEFASVALNKLKFGWEEVEEAVTDVRQRCGPAVMLDEVLHEDGLRLARRYRLSVYDGMIVAAALMANCDLLYSEDMHHGLIVDGRLQILNPFRPQSA